MNPNRYLVGRFLSLWPIYYTMAVIIIFTGFIIAGLAKGNQALLIAHWHWSSKKPLLYVSYPSNQFNSIWTVKNWSISLFVSHHDVFAVCLSFYIFLWHRLLCHIFYIILPASLPTLLAMLIGSRRSCESLFFLSK